jgi:Ankyrin repeats (3 copies)
MASMHAQACSTVESSNPLLHLGVLRSVLSFIGPGHHLFVTPVCKWWKQVYYALGSQQLPACLSTGRKIIFTCVPQMMLFSSVFTSPSRVQLAHKSGLKCASRAYELAAGKHADVATLAAAHELGMQYTDMTMCGAAESNKIAEVQFLHSQGQPWPVWMFAGLARSGFFELLRWCYEHGCPWDANAPHYAAESGNVELMQWVLQQQPGTTLSADAMTTAASKGHTAMCEFLHAQQCPWDTFAVMDAAYNGHVSVLRWLMDNGCPWIPHNLCMAAGEGGSIEVLTFLQQQGILDAQMLTHALDNAAFLGRLAAAQWLREQGAE